MYKIQLAVDMRIFSFDLILAMDFLNKIAEFMTTGMAEDVQAIKEEGVTKSVQDKSVESIVVIQFVLYY